MIQQNQPSVLQQLQTYREELVAIVKNVTTMEAEIIPQGFRNNIRWHMGHIYLDQFLWIQVLTKEEIVDLGPFNKFFGFGTTPTHFNEHTPSFETLIELLSNQPSLITQHYGEALDKKYSSIDMGMSTIQDVLIRTIFHEGIHLQSIKMIKKQIKEGFYNEYTANKTER